MNIFQEISFLLVAERKGDTARPGTSCTADAVYIGLRDVRQFVIDHKGQLVDINAAGGNVGSYQYARGAVLKVSQCTLAGILRFVAVYRFGSNAYAG